MNRSRRIRLVAVLGALVLASLVAAAAEVSALLSAAKERMADREFAAASRSLSDVAEKEKGTPAGMEASFLILKAAVSAGDFAGALEAGERFLRDYPGAAYGSKARFLMADAYAGLKRWSDAAEVYRERAEFMSGEAYRAKLAKLYVELADEGGSTRLNCHHAASGRSAAARNRA